MCVFLKFPGPLSSIFKKDSSDSVTNISTSSSKSNKSSIEINYNFEKQKKNIIHSNNDMYRNNINTHNKKNLYSFDTTSRNKYESHYSNYYVE